MTNQTKPWYAEGRKGYDRYDYVAWAVLTAILAIVMLCFSTCTPAQAEVIPDNLAVKAVYNEALHDTESLNAMCHALRNRGVLKGVYGLRSTNTISPKEYAKTLKTWQNSLYTPDVTKGATHWLSDYDLKHCKPSLMSWRFKMKETLYQGQTHYYKEN